VISLLSHLISCVSRYIGYLPLVAPASDLSDIALFSGMRG
jgi:hypothetical protein